MKIIETRVAPNPRRVRIFLAEKGIEVAFEQVDMMKGDCQTPEFRAKNPMAQVPVLVLDDGTWLAETVAICRYFEATHPTPALFGTGPVGIATVEMWQRRVEMHLLFNIAQTFRHTHPAMAHLEVPQVPAWGEATRPRAFAAMELLDRQLAAHPFIAGEAFSIADITAMVAVNFLRPLRMKMPEQLTHLARWYGEVSARPSAGA